MEITLRIPDDVVKRLSAAGGDLSRRALEARALEGYRDQTLTLYQISEMLGLSRVETEDFLGRRHASVPLCEINEAELDREAAVFEAGSRRTLLASSRHDCRFQYLTSPVSHRHWPRRSFGKVIRESVRTNGCP
jgi:uncharacterized protein UPF0175